MEWGSGKKTWWPIWHCLRVFIFIFFKFRNDGKDDEGSSRACTYATFGWRWKRRCRVKISLGINLCFISSAWKTKGGRNHGRMLDFRMLKIEIGMRAHFVWCAKLRDQLLFSNSADLQIKLKWAPKYLCFFFFTFGGLIISIPFRIAFIREKNSNLILIESVWLVIGNFPIFQTSNKWLMTFQQLETLIEKKTISRIYEMCEIIKLLSTLFYDGEDSEKKN